MKVLKEEKTAELIVKKSRFISIARICTSPSDVKRIVDETRRQFPDATHVVHAAVMGSQFSFSDDHEPKNTAGRPALEVLKGSGITNIIVLIIRYFGGTLLGPHHSAGQERRGVRDGGKHCEVHGGRTRRDRRGR